MGITENIDEVIKNKLKDELQIDEDIYLHDNMEGFVLTVMKKV